MFENKGVTLHITWIPVKMNCMKKKEIGPHLKSNYRLKCKNIQKFNI